MILQKRNNIRRCNIVFIYVHFKTYLSVHVFFKHNKGSQGCAIALSENVTGYLTFLISITYPKMGQ
ncbi:hypothetical protein Bamy01_11220 [Bacillus amyloliquefaciens]|nr:hypothetical protein Bamy01_11220 [Bacillus amyloliquefaciens]